MIISHNAFQQTFSFSIMQFNGRMFLVNKLGKPLNSTSVLYEVPVYATFDIFSKIFYNYYKLLSDFTYIYIPSNFIAFIINLKKPNRITDRSATPQTLCDGGSQNMYDLCHTLNFHKIHVCSIVTSESNDIYLFEIFQQVHKETKPLFLRLL